MGCAYPNPEGENMLRIGFIHKSQDGFEMALIRIWREWYNDLGEVSDAHCLFVLYPPKWLSRLVFGTNQS